MKDLSAYRERLAREVMGWMTHGVWYRRVNGDHTSDLHQDDFRPDEDVAQAIQVLEALAQRGLSGGRNICCIDLRWRTFEGWEVMFQEQNTPHDKHFVLTKSFDELPQAIVTAVVKAMGWDE